MGGGGRLWQRRDPGLPPPPTWRSIQQWRRITASVRKATVHAAFSSAPWRPRATTMRMVRPRDAMDRRILCSWGRKGGKWELGEEPYGEASRGHQRAWVGASPPYLLGTAGSSHPTLPSGGCSSSQVFLSEMEVWGARPRPLCPWPTLPHSGLQVLKDDRTVVAEHVRDAAGTEPCLARHKTQQSQQERPEYRLGRHLEGTLGQGRGPRPVDGASPTATPQAICFGQPLGQPPGNPWAGIQWRCHCAIHDRGMGLAGGQTVGLQTRQLNARCRDLRGE